MQMLRLKIVIQINGLHATFLSTIIVSGIARSSLNAPCYNHVALVSQAYRPYIEEHRTD